MGGAAGSSSGYFRHWVAATDHGQCTGAEIVAFCLVRIELVTRCTFLVGQHYQGFAAGYFGQAPGPGSSIGIADGLIPDSGQRTAGPHTSAVIRFRFDGKRVLNIIGVGAIPAL